jgi:hypothetical protein
MGAACVALPLALAGGAALEGGHLPASPVLAGALGRRTVSACDSSCSGGSGLPLALMHPPAPCARGGDGDSAAGGRSSSTSSVTDEGQCQPGGSLLPACMGTPGAAPLHASSAGGSGPGSTLEAAAGGSSCGDAAAAPAAGGAAAAGGTAAAGDPAADAEPLLARELGVTAASLARLFRADGKHDFEQPVWMVVNLQVRTGCNRRSANWFVAQAGGWRSTRQCAPARPLAAGT